MACVKVHQAHNIKVTSTELKLCRLDKYAMCLPNFPERGVPVGYYFPGRTGGRRVFEQHYSEKWKERMCDLCRITPLSSAPARDEGSRCPSLFELLGRALCGHCQREREGN